MTIPSSREIPVVEQIVPSSACAVCDVCCRFPEAESALRPYFTREEIQAAIAAGVSPAAFPEHAGSKIAVVPHGDGYVCPAFETATGRCGIYHSRPLDCRLYPIAVMWNAAKDQIVMGWDAKCPFIVQKLESSESKSYVERTARLLETDAMARTFITNPQLVGAFQEDVLILQTLKRITEGLKKQREMGSESILPEESVDRRQFEKSTLTPLTLADRAWFEQRIRDCSPGGELAAYSFPYHFIWRDVFVYEWAVLEEHVCLFASNQDGTFLALPPLGPDPSGMSLKAAFALMAERNRVPGLSRVENVPGWLAEQCRSQGYRVQFKAGEYVYRRIDLVELKGDRYKSQRGCYNQCVTQSAPRFRPYRAADRDACLGLYAHWQQSLPHAPEFGRFMAEDAASAHRLALSHAEELGLTGYIAEAEGRIAGYTFGYPLTESIFCVLLEITDRQIRGLSQYIFREFCRQVPAAYINAMDDSDLDGLRRAKERYHPEKIIPAFIVTEAGERS